MPTILGANTLSSGFDVANSLMFNDDDSAYLNKTPAGDGSRVKWTWSGWVKRCSFGHQPIFATPGNSSNIYDEFYFNSTDKIQYSAVVSGTQYALRTKRKFRDTNAWYHIVLIVDSNNGTAGDRMQLWINGVRTPEADMEDTTFKDAQNYSTATNKASYVTYLGRVSTNTAAYFDGYMAEVVFQNDNADSPVDKFGEFDEDSGIWKPIDVSGLTLGTNGFYLDFEDSSDLGNDAAGSNNWSSNNLAATDQMTDTPTNNFATMNPLDNFYASSTFAEGNLKITTNASNQTFNTGTIGLSTGKWYWEAKLVQAGGEEAIGITDIDSTGTGIYGGKTANNYSFKGNNGDIRNNDSNSSYGSAYAEDSIVGVFMDLDNNKLYFAVDGTLQNSGTGHSITAAASTTNGVYFPMVGDVDSDSVIWECNFGSPTFAISSGNTDGEYGNFEYTTTITGDSVSKTFKAINTKNLAEFG